MTENEIKNSKVSVGVLKKVKDDLSSKIDDVSAELNAIANCEPLQSDDLTFVWNTGRISSGIIKPSAPHGFTDNMPYTDKSIIFDTTKYKILFVKCDSSGNVLDYTGWKTTSPFEVPVNYPYFRIEASTIDNSQFDVPSAKSAITLEGTIFPLLTEKVLNSEAKIEEIEKHINKYVYVNCTVGNDQNIGSKSEPFKTIQKGVNSGAKIVYVASGDYVENVRIENIDEISILPDTYPAFSATNMQNTPMIHITGNDNQSITNGLKISDCGIVNIVDVWCDNTSSASAVSIRTKKLNMINCCFSNANNGDSNGLELVNTNGVFRNCIAYNIAKDGFNIHQYGNTQFIDCHAYDCGDDGISHHDGCTGSVIGGEFYNCGKAGVATPTYGALIDVDGVYCHNNVYGFYSVNESGRRTTRGNVRNSIFQNNTVNDIYIGRSIITSWNNIYTTKYVSENGVFTDIGISGNSTLQ